MSILPEHAHRSLPATCASLACLAHLWGHVLTPLMRPRGHNFPAKKLNNWCRKMMRKVEEASVHLTLPSTSREKSDGLGPRSLNPRRSISVLLPGALSPEAKKTSDSAQKQRQPTQKAQNKAAGAPQEADHGKCDGSLESPALSAAIAMPCPSQPTWRHCGHGRVLVGIFFPAACN